MSSKRATRPFGGVTARLTLQHASLFAFLSLATFVFVYYTVRANLIERADRELREDVREVEGNLMLVPAPRRQEVFFEDFDAADAAKEFRLLLAPDRTILLSSDLAPWRQMRAVPAGVERLAPGQELTHTAWVPGLDIHARVVVRRLADRSFVELGTSMADNDDLLALLRKIFAIFWVATMVPGVLLGWFVARRAMAGVDRVTATAVRIGESDLTQRVPVGHEGEEIENLARAFNAMLDRIHLLVRELNDVTSNIAHDLKSPITRIRGLAESAATANAQAPGAEPAGWIVDECDRVARSIDTILEIAAADAGVSEQGRADVDIAAVTRDAVDLFQPVAEDRGIRLALDLPATPLAVRGDVGRIQRVVANLLDNAIKYTPAGGTVRVTAGADADRVTLSIADTGIGIAPESLPRVFERFYRGDASRSTPGYGLGLSLARAIVRAHGGDIAVHSVQGQGSTFTILWPAAHAGA